MGMTFRTKLVLIFVAVITCQGLLIGLYSYNHAKNIVEDTKESELSDMVNRIDMNINVKVRNIIGLLEGTASSQIIKDSITNNNENDAVFYKTFLEEYFNNIKLSDSSISNILLLNNSKVVFTNRKDKKGLENSSILEYYEKTAKDNPNRTLWLGTTDSIYQDGEEINQVISVICTILDEEQGKVLGVLVCEIEPTTFSNLLLLNQNDFKNQYTYIVDKNQNVIATNNSGLKREWVKTIDKQFHMGPRKYNIKLEDKEYYVCGQYNGITGWRTYSIIMRKKIFPQSGILKNSVLFFVCITTIGISILIMIVSYTLTRPIEALVKAMKTIQEGNFDTQIPNKRKDEIGKLTNSFNFMIIKIKTLIQVVYAEKLEQKNAELRALQTQINPHFLYNTLDSINWMLIDKEEYQISEVVVSLGDLMKYAIDKKSTLVTIEEEFEYLQSYFTIQKNRLEDRLTYSVEIDEGVKSFRILKLLVQPLVENAITHGIEPCKKVGIIKIKGYEDEECIYITVSDNGQGIKKEELELLLNSQADDKSDIGIGIQNVDKRIRLHYGDEYKLKIESDYGIGTKVTIRIPKKPD